MTATALFRLSGCLVTAGYGLLVMSAPALLLGILVMVTAPRGIRDPETAHEARAKAEAIAALEQLPVPAALLDEFRNTGRVVEQTLANLPPEERLRVRRVLLDYYGKRVSSGTATLVTAGLAGAATVLLVVLGIPGLIVALLLIRKRKVWKCVTCGFAFERA